MRFVLENPMRTTIILCVSIAAMAVFGAWLHAKPGRAFQDLQIAMDRDDPALMAPLLDLDALKSNIKNREAAKLSQAAPKDGPGALMGLFGQALADSVIGALVQGVVSPEGVLAMLRGAAASAPEIPGKAPKTPSERLFGQASTELIGFNRYVATAHLKGDAVLRLVFARTGTAWRLSDIEIAKAKGEKT